MNLNDISPFYIIIAAFTIPILLGFLQEAGKDFYNTLRKREVSGKCFEHVMMSRDVNEMRGNQKELREGRLPRIETKLETIITSQEETRKNIEKLFNLWDNIKPK